MVTEHRYMEGSAYRHNRLVCERVGITILRDGRIAPDRPAARHVSVRFLQGLDVALRNELLRLVHARGARGIRFAETLAPIQVKLLEHHRGEHGVVGRLEPPTARNGPLEEIAFRLREARR